MEINVTHTLTLSDDAKAFLTELFGQRAGAAHRIIPNSPREGMSAHAAVEVVPTAETPAPERKKVVPPGIACTRIGQDTTDAIMKLLPANIETVERAIKRKRFDAEALLKLLWERNKLGYDGEVYHAVR